MRFRPPRKLSLVLTAAGAVVGAALALVPVRAEYVNDPLVRLHELDPDLIPPSGTANCGAPLFHLSVTSSGPSLVELAKADSCQSLARRRVTEAVAAAALLFSAAALARAEPASPSPAAPAARPLPPQAPNAPEQESSGDAEAVGDGGERGVPTEEREDEQAPAP